MQEIVVYLTEDYSKNKSIFVSNELSRDEITKEVNKEFDVWFYYDII